MPGTGLDHGVPVDLDGRGPPHRRHPGAVESLAADRTGAEHAPLGRVRVLLSFVLAGRGSPGSRLAELLLFRHRLGRGCRRGLRDGEVPGEWLAVHLAAPLLAVPGGDERRVQAVPEMIEREGHQHQRQDAEGQPAESPGEGAQAALGQHATETHRHQHCEPRPARCAGLGKAQHQRHQRERADSASRTAARWRARAPGRERGREVTNAGSTCPGPRPRRWRRAGSSPAAGAPAPRPG